MKTFLFQTIILPSILLISLQITAKDIITKSPDGKAEIILSVTDKLLISVKFQGSVIMNPSEQKLSILEFPKAFANPKIAKISVRSINDTIYPPVPEKRSIIPDNCNQTDLWLKSGVGLRMVAYNDGVAWRFLSKLPGTITVLDETMDLKMAASDSVYFGEEDNFISHSERQYPLKSVSEITENQWCVVPAVFRKANNHIAAFSEADLLDYPGIYLKGAGNNCFKGIFANVVKGEKISADKRSYIPEGRENYIAKTSGTREFPWRLFGLSINDAGMLSNDIVYRLGSPLNISETSWIKPGKVAWDWWNDWNFYDVPFKAGINTQTYKTYIAFASKYGLQYVILDEGWSANDDLDKINPAMDMEELFRYAKQKNVRLILWVTGKALEDKWESSFAKFEKWGVAGIKVDFLIRDDQQMVNFYEKVAAEAAKHKMLVDFHGSYKPTGLSRTYPNQLTREGVPGLENCKWSKKITPAHDCTLPFTRMFAGPMDYTPGAMVNSHPEEFIISNSKPMSIGTRTHELAKYVVFESPLQMLCDVPMNYEREPDAMKLLSSVPTTWDETIGIDALIGKFVIVARRSENTWYLGAMTDNNARTFEITPSFLGKGNYTMEIWSDGPNAEKRAQDCLYLTQTVNNTSKIVINLSRGGGYVARFTGL